MNVSVTPDLSTVVRLGVLVFEDARVSERDARLDAALAEVVTRMRAVPADEGRTAAVRSMYRRLGIDPTKTRPSSEALLRRVRKGEPLPRINMLVDICNWCSLEFQLPYGLYDADGIREPIELRRGAPNEQYPGIRKEVVHLEGRPTLADSDGPFGNPTSDSARTMVLSETRRLLVVVYAPRTTDVAELRFILEATSSRIVSFTGASEVHGAML